MKPLIDADILLWEVGSVSQDKEGEPKDFDFVQAVLDGKIQDICEAAGGTEPPTLYLTGKGNFREAIAVTQPYKGNRKDVVKPYHTENIKVYMRNQYDVVTVEGMEADDAMCVEQVKAWREYQSLIDTDKELEWEEIPPATIICTRDKDLRMVPGWHYGWECGHQREFGPELVEYEGYLTYENKKLKGVGIAFFYAQLLMGDSTDHIPGLPRVGPKRVHDVLGDLRTEDMFSAVCDEYRMKGKTPEYLLEQGRLLWMVRELHEDGSPVMWEIPV